MRACVRTYAVAVVVCGRGVRSSSSGGSVRARVSGERGGYSQ